MYTLNTTDTHGVVWPETALALKARHDGSPEPDVGGGQNIVCYALDQQGGKGGANWAQNQTPPILSDSHGTPHAVAYGFSANQSDGARSLGYHEEVSPTLRGGQGGNQKPYLLAVDVYNMSVEPDGAQTLKARDYKDPQTINDDRGG